MPILQLSLHDGRQDDLPKQRRKQIDVLYQNEIIYRSSIGDDEPHLSESQAFEALALAFGVFQGVVNPNVVGFQETI